MKPTFYVTTPIYYVNDVPHIGHAYTTVAADVLARYKRLMGFDVYFLTGSDEHGQKVEKAATTAGETPLELADRVVKRFQALWERLGISHNDFIRTTQERHKKGVAHIFKDILDEGRHLPGGIRGLVLHPLRDLLDRDPADRGALPRLQPPGGKAQGGILFLPHEQVPGAAAGPHRRPSGFHPAQEQAQRDHLLRQGGSARPVRFPHDLLLGHPGPG